MKIREVSKDFALRIIRLCKYLLDKYAKDIIVPVLVKQVLRSGTSIAANVAESMNAQSNKDFASKLSIALKEASETQMWLELLHESFYLDDHEYESLHNDCSRIIAILIRIIKKVKAKEQGES